MMHLPSYHAESTIEAEPVPNIALPERPSRLPRHLLMFAACGLLVYVISLAYSLSRLPPTLDRAICGGWQATDASGFAIEFTQEGATTISHHGQAFLHAEYVLIGDGEIELKNPRAPTGRPWPTPAGFMVSLQRDRLFITRPEREMIAARDRNVLGSSILSGRSTPRFW